MPRKLKIAAIQMDAAPAPVTERLGRAADLIAEAASSGAQLIVLPEVFNTGYTYSNHNYSLAETIDGQTVTWMKEQTAEHKIHLAGSILHIDGDHVYNSMFLVAPDGRTWRYDKNFPWAFERAYFREGKTITIADTDLGKFGMMICWDYAHPELWARYAGKVDAMIVTSCPPTGNTFDVVFPDGERENMIVPNTYTGKDAPFGADFDQQVAWMRVPAVQTTATGTFHSKLPVPQMLFTPLFMSKSNPIKQLRDMRDAVVESGYFTQTKIIDAQGTVLGRVAAESEGFELAEVELADTVPQPLMPQPQSAFTPFAYLNSDWAIPALMTSNYRRGYRRQLGGHMTPVDHSTKVWGSIIGAAVGFGWLLGKFFKIRRKF
jgi:hypothetical protein